MDEDSSKRQLADCIAYCIIGFSGPSNYFPHAEPVRSNIFHLYVCLEFLPSAFIFLPFPLCPPDKFV